MVEVVVDQMTFDFALAGHSRDYHFSSFKVVVATLLVPSHDDKPVGVSSSVAHVNGESLTTLSPQLLPVKGFKALLNPSRLYEVWQRSDPLRDASEAF